MIKSLILNLLLIPLFIHRGTSSVLLSPAEKQVLHDHFSSDGLSKSALSYEAQDTQIKALPTKANPIQDTSAVLSMIATDIGTRLYNRVLATEKLSNDSKIATTSKPDTAWESCCTLGTTSTVEMGYDSYYKTFVNRKNMCTRGECREARVLSGTPTCEKSVLGVEFKDSAIVNSQANDGGAWQYFGSEVGVFTMFPAATPSESSCKNATTGEAKEDEYDPRLRPWYLAALSSKALDVAIIFDKSGSMVKNNRMVSAKRAVKTILGMLRPFDRFGVAAFSSPGLHEPPMTNFSCQMDELSFATKRNIDQMNAFVDAVNADGATFYVDGLKMAMDMFKGTVPPESEDPNDRLKILMFVSDGEPSDYGKEIMTKLAEFMVQEPELIVLTYGLDVTAAALQAMADHDYAKYGLDTNTTGFKNGHFENLTPTDMRIKLGTFYGYPEIRVENTDVHWSLPYVDALGMGLMVTASKAVYVDSNLQGVVGYDITMAYLMEPVEFLVTESTYAFMLDTYRGSIISHPRLMNPQSAVTDISPVHYSIYESDAAIAGDIESIINGTTTSTTSVGIQRYKIINRDDGVTITGNNPEYSSLKETVDVYCQRVISNGVDFKLVLCIVRDNSLKKNALDTATFLSSRASATSNFFYHRTDLERDTSQVYCKHGFRRAKMGEAAIKFSARQYTHPTQYLTVNETKLDVIRLEKWLTGDGSMEKFDDGDVVKSFAIASETLDAAWKAQDADLSTQYSSEKAKKELKIETDVPIAVWRYFGSADGTHRTWPGVQITAAYDPTMRPWYRLAMTDTSKTFLSAPYVDAFGMGYVITITRALKLTNGETAGVLGTDYFLKQVGDLVENNFKDCELNTCLVLDSTGNVIWWKKMVTNVEYVTRKEAVIEGQEGIDYERPLNADDIMFGTKLASEMLIDAHLMKIVKCHDTVFQKTRKSIDIHITECSTQTGSILCPMPDTNSFLFVVEGDGVIHEKKEKRRLVPDEKDYQTCRNKYADPEDISACQGPPAFLSNEYLGAFSKDVGFQYETISNYDNCYDWMERWMFYALYPQGPSLTSWIAWVRNFFFILLTSVVGFFIVCWYCGDD